MHESRFSDNDANERVTLRVPDEMLALVDSAVEGGLYSTRSKAIRAALANHFGQADGDHVDRVVAVADAVAADRDADTDAVLVAALGDVRKRGGQDE